MAKSRSFYICQSCGTSHSKWAGQCEGCGEWDVLAEEVQEVVPKGLSASKNSASGRGKAITFSALGASSDEAPAIPSGLVELDRVLGGGLVTGAAILIGGDPGIGKSTLLLQAAAAVAQQGLSTLYISGEESQQQISLRAARLGLEKADVQLASTASVRDIISTLERGPAPQAVIIDSIQTMYVDSLDSAPGTVSQVRASAHELVRLAKKRGFTLFLVGHVTKDGQIAGPRVLEHMVDTVLYFEGERGHSFRILRTVKNRFGSTEEIGVFDMTEQGLQQVVNPSALFLGEREEGISGSAVFAGMEGTRPVLVEIQALVASSPMATPRRAVVGWDSGRLSMLLAVLEARCGVNLSDREVYLNVAGGFRVREPAADLAVVAAILSAFSDEPIPPRTVIFGEVGLSGEVRPVSHAERRLREAAKLGFASALYPKSAKAPVIDGLKGSGIGHIRGLVERLLPDKQHKPAQESV